MPSGEFVQPPLAGPAIGLEPHEFDSGAMFRQNADSTNEGTGKLKGLLQYLHMFEENQITDLLGYKHIILSRRNGGIGSEGDGCLKPSFYITKTQLVRVYFRPAYHLVPGGDTQSLIPLVPQFQGVYLDKPMDPENGEGQVLSNGEWSAWLKIEGYESEITVQEASLAPPAPPANIQDGAVWHLARWSIEGSGTKNVKIVDPEYFSCPFLPTLEENTHPFFPFFYQKKKTLEVDKDTDPDQWYMKVYWGNLHDLHTGNHYRFSRADAQTEIAVSAGQTWFAKLNTSNLGVPGTLSLVSGSVSTQPFQPPEDGVTTGQGGIYAWRLFDILATQRRLVPRIYHGSDISWYRWLHDNLTTAASGVGRVYKQFNTTSYKHEFRHLIGGGDVQVIEYPNHIVISCDCSAT